MFYNILIVFLCANLQAFVSTVLAILLALPLAHFCYKFDFFCKNFLISLAAVLCIFPTKLAAICVSLFYSTNLAKGFTGIILAHLMLNVAFAFYIINLAYCKFDITLLWLASEAGAQGWRCYRDIIFPILKPTLVSVFFLLFLLHFASFSIPLILGNSSAHNTPEIIVYNFYSAGDNFSALITWAIRLLIILPIFFLHNKHAQENIKMSSVPVILPIAKFSIFGKNILYLVYFIFILIITVGPLIALIIKSCDKIVFDFICNIFTLISDPLLGECVYRVILNSIFLAFTSAIGTVFVASLICILELKLKNKFYKNIFGLITVLPFIIGSVGIGIVFVFFNNYNFTGPFLIGLLAHIFLNYVFVYRIIKAQVVLYHPDLTKTAQALGASYKQAIITVVVPFVWPAIIRAFCVSFGLSLTEVGAGAILQGKVGLTMPMAIRIYRQAGCQEAVIGLSLVLLFLVLLVTYFFSRKDYSIKNPHI